MNGKSMPPLIGPGNTPMCQRCVEKMKQDVRYQIVEELKKMSFPMRIVNGRDEWADIISLLEIRKALYNKGAGFVQAEDMNGSRRRATGEET